MSTRARRRWSSPEASTSADSLLFITRTRILGFRLFRTICCACSFFCGFGTSGWRGFRRFCWPWLIRAFKVSCWLTGRFTVAAVSRRSTLPHYSESTRLSRPATLSTPPALAPDMRTRKTFLSRTSYRGSASQLCMELALSPFRTSKRKMSGFLLSTPLSTRWTTCQCPHLCRSTHLLSSWNPPALTKSCSSPFY